jgi:hypothetical protein
MQMLVGTHDLCRLADGILCMKTDSTSPMDQAWANQLHELWNQVSAEAEYLQNDPSRLMQFTNHLPRLARVCVAQAAVPTAN